MFELLIAFWLTITPPTTMITDTTAVFLSEWKLTTPDTYLLNKANFSIKDEDDISLPIYSVQKLSTLDGLSITETKVLALKTVLPEYGKTYTFTAVGYTPLTFFNNGFASNLEKTPVFILEK